jgi:flap endonuclease-1
MVESGIKPIYVFDGKPPTLKSGEVRSRKSSFRLTELSYGLILPFLQ